LIINFFSESRRQYEAEFDFQLANRKLAALEQRSQITKPLTVKADVPLIPRTLRVSERSTKGKVPNRFGNLSSYEHRRFS
jgi:hypothetical protein